MSILKRIKSFFKDKFSNKDDIKELSEPKTIIKDDKKDEFFKSLVDLRI